MGGDGDLSVPPFLERPGILLSSDVEGVPLQQGDKDFKQQLSQCFSSAESNALEELTKLKTALRSADTEDFWKLLMEGLTNIPAAQYAFVAKRIDFDDQNAAIPMPPIGQPGSCLMGVAFYYNDNDKFNQLHRNYKYYAWSAPCAYMAYNKTFLIPKGLNDFIPNNPNPFPFPAEAYLAIPLFSHDECFAHFGIMWSADGLKSSRLGWGFIEMLLHTLEDIVLERLLRGEGFAKPGIVVAEPAAVAQDSNAAVPSLSPYARSLSHELRTPMQGVVGMLDVLHATIREALGTSPPEGYGNIFHKLQEDIEVVQDSSRRAVEATENIVHAHEFGIQAPRAPDSAHKKSRERVTQSSAFSKTSNTLSNDGDRSVACNKRRRSSSFTSGIYEPPLKFQAFDPYSNSDVGFRRDSGEPSATANRDPWAEFAQASRSQFGKSANAPRTFFPTERISPRDIRPVKVRTLLRKVVMESLRSGDRRCSAEPCDTELGQIIEVKTHRPNDAILTKRVEWTVDPLVPETIMVNAQALEKVLAAVIRNADKFTEEGKISITAKMGLNFNMIVFTISDTGPGIPEEFRSKLFQAFSRAEQSLTRKTEGLGLGLLVAKNCARLMGGDLKCVHTSTSGPERGSVFELDAPVSTSNSMIAAALPASEEPASSSKQSDDPPESSRASSKKPIAAPPSPLPSSSSLADPSAAFDKSALMPGGGGSNPAPIHKSRPPASNPKAFDNQLAAKFPYNFLVAEDNRINRTLLVTMLKKFGYRNIRTAYDGVDAVRQIEESLSQPDNRVDIILMDLWMPNMSGYEATEKAFEIAKEKGHKLRIFAVTADGTEAALERTREVGMEGFMLKPYGLEDLQRLIIGFSGGEQQE